MTTLNQSLHQTSHQSSLVRKAGRLGFLDIESLIQLAVLRGCTHYQNVIQGVPVHDPGQSILSNEELVALLLHGNYRYEPTAVRCAAQLIKSDLIDPERIGFLAIKERCVVPLRHIALNSLAAMVDFDVYARPGRGPAPGPARRRRAGSQNGRYSLVQELAIVYFGYMGVSD